MKEKQKGLLDTKKTPLYERIREILELARTNISRTVNTTRVVANWLIGREIVEEEQKGEERAEYGHQLLEEISEHLKSEFGAGYSVDNLELFRRFYLVYSDLISDALRRKSFEEANIFDALPRKLNKTNRPFGFEIGHTVSNDSCKPGQLHSNLSWTHYRALVRVDKKGARAFYEIESVRNNWTARELERQINSLLYERLALSKDKKGLMSLATKGQEIQKPADVFKDPLIVQQEGSRKVSRAVSLYNLDVIISIGYRIKSQRGTQFRIWATERLREYIVKGFTLDDDRLKQAGGGIYFEELLERIRDIRSSEKVFWRKVLDIYATSIDYDPGAEMTQQFFATVQNKMHWAAHGQTAAEVISHRADASLLHMGLTSWEGSRPHKSDVGVAKNYLQAEEFGYSQPDRDGLPGICGTPGP